MLGIDIFSIPPPTTTLSSFTDGLIPSVIAMKSVGEPNTDGFTDGLSPSVNQSSVNPISVANSVANKKNHPPTETPTVIQTDRRAKKKIPRGNITDGQSVGKFKGNYQRHHQRVFRRYVWHGL